MAFPAHSITGPGAAGSSEPPTWLAMACGEETTTGIHFYLSVPLNSLTPPLGGVSREDVGALPPASCSLRSSPAWLGLDSDRDMGGVPFLAIPLPEEVLGLAVSAGAPSHL